MHWPVRQAQTLSSPLQSHAVLLTIFLPPEAVVSAERGHAAHTHCPDLHAHSETSPAQPQVVVWISATILLRLIGLGDRMCVCGER